MGVYTHLTGDGPMNGKKMDIETGFVWVVCRIQKVPEEQRTPDGPKNRWYIQGIMYYEADAINACLDENYFIGPLPVNTVLPHEMIEWVGSYFPLRTQQLT